MTRGWTLQELLASSNLIYFDESWRQIGTKISLAVAVSETTSIPLELLSGKRELAQFSVAARFSWAAARQTTRTEDRAYSLLGVVGVSMPLIYGEGDRAFRRLQEEIIKRHNDLTIFAWNNPSAESRAGRLLHSQSLKHEFVGVLAASPHSFAGMGRVVPFVDDFADFALTNRGVLLSKEIPIRKIRLDDCGLHLRHMYAVCLGMDTSTTGSVGLCLRKIGPHLFHRCSAVSLLGLGSGQKWTQIDRLDSDEGNYIMIDPTKSIIASLGSAFRNHAVHVPRGPVAASTPDKRLKLLRVAPESVWDCTDQVFLRARAHSWSRYPMVLVCWFYDHIVTRAEIVVLCFYETDASVNAPVLRVFDPDQLPTVADAIAHADGASLLRATQLMSQHPKLHDLSDHVIHEVPGRRILTRAYLEFGRNEEFSEEHYEGQKPAVCSLRFRRNFVAVARKSSVSKDPSDDSQPQDWQFMQSGAAMTGGKPLSWNSATVPPETRCRL
jgi:hypothetical protein